MGTDPIERRDCILDTSAPSGLVDWVRCFLWHWQGSGVPEQIAAAAIVSVVESSLTGVGKDAPYLTRDPKESVKELGNSWR